MLGFRILAVACGYATLASYLFWSSWLRWPDAWVDFGYFLYNAWQVSEGAAIGRDISYFYGPLALLFYGKLFSLFGASITLVYVVNALLLVVDCALLFAIFRRLSASFAHVAVVVFLALFALGQAIYEGNYNFMAPYKPEVSVGFPLLLAFVWTLLRNELHMGSRKAWFACGTLMGATCMTSSEFALACVAAFGAWAASSERVTLVRKTWPLLSGAAAAFLLMFACLAMQLTLPLALRHTFRTFAILGNTQLVFLPMLQELMGIDKPALRALEIIQTTSIVTLIVMVITLLAPTSRRNLFFAAATALVLLIALLTAGAVSLWFALPKLLPVALVAGTLYWIQAPGKRMLAGVWTAVSAAVLLRMILNPMLHYYGFVLALPATLLLLAVCIEIIPELLRARGKPAGGSIAFGLALTLFLVGTGFWLRAPFFNLKDQLVSPKPDILYDWSGATSQRGKSIQKLVQFMKDEIAPGESVLILPDGHIAYYLSRRQRPGPSISAGDLAEVGEQAILDSYARNKPKYVFIYKRERYERESYGFGITYGKLILKWVNDNYKPMPGKFDGTSFYALVAR